MEKGIIIVLNGVSSSGKTTLARELTKWLPDFFRAELDEFDQWVEKVEERKNGRLIPVATERLFHRSVVMLSEEGVNIIADTVLHDTEILQDFYRILEGYPVLFVGVNCPADELSRREAARGDRRIGQAVEQLQFVHRQGESYHLEVDTFHNSTAECSQQIVTALKQARMHPLRA